MKQILAIALGLALSSAAAAQEGPIHDLSCSATHDIACEGGACASEAGESIHVSVSVALASGVGNICTFTYCRDFMLTPAPGDTVENAVSRWTGFTLSESRGSTEEHQGRPTIDYQLSISEDRSRFVLGGLDDGRFSGWAGTCQARAQN